MIQFCGETPFFAPKARQNWEATPDLFLGMHIKKVIIQGFGSYAKAENPELFMPGVNAIRTRVAWCERVGKVQLLQGFAFGRSVIRSDSIRPESKVYED